MIHLRRMTRASAAVAVLFLAVSGCGKPLVLRPLFGPASQPTPLPTTDRMVAAYPDLASKRFQVIADFETPEQASLFKPEPLAGAGALGITTDRARTETGVGAFRMVLPDPRHHVVAAESTDSKWALPHDWSGHHLLLLSVYSPRKLGGFRVSVRSGTTSALTFNHRPIVLDAGWNLLRIDLGEMIDQINLADVRELRFWCDPLDTPTELFLDDIILTSNARDVFGTPEGRRGDLYVRAEGRRLVVGCVERFELVFSQGRLRQWYDLGSDPQRSRNLTGGGYLGPLPVVIPADPAGQIAIEDMSQWAALGLAAEVVQTMAEATPLRVIIQGEARFAPPDSPPNESSPYHRWTYTIYRDGRVYAECQGSARAQGFAPQTVGMAFCCDGAFKRTVVPLQTTDGEGNTSAAAARQAPPGAPYALFSRTDRGQADLLVVPSAPLTPRTMQNPKDNRLTVLWPVPVSTETFAFAAMLRVWPADIDSPQQAGPLAGDYRTPLPLSVDVGHLVKTDPGDFNADGFSEGRGQYVLGLDGNIAKVRIDGRRILRFGPVFKLLDVADREVWAYVDGRQIRDLTRDTEGNAIFQVPGPIAHEALLEIASAKREAAPKP